MNNAGKNKAHGRSKPLSEQTRRRIFAAFRELREKGYYLDDDERHKIQYEVTKKGSLRDFTENDGENLLRALNIGGQTQRIRKKYTGRDGKLAIHIPATSTRAQINKAYALMHEINDLEERSYAVGLLEKPENYSSDVKARLDGWAQKMTKGEAAQLGEMMKEEISDLIEALKDQADRLRQTLPPNN